MLPQFRKPEGDGSKTQTGGTQAPPSLNASPLGVRQTAQPFRSGSPGTTSVIGPDLIVHGNLMSKGEVQIEGEVQGDIHGTHVVVGEKARITGGIIAEECIIRGHVLGTVRGRRVLLQTTSHVEGDIYHQTVAIEQGAFFEGKSRRTDDPIAGISRPDRRPEPMTASVPPPMASAESETPPPLQLP
jgi:cytoskeletal protein CcmA (bactofilin family)